MEDTARGDRRPDRDGCASVQRTPLIASGFGSQRLLAPEDVERARTLRRDDLPGRPLGWQVAVCQLVQQLGAGSCARE
jgi:hypothetical protein